MYVLESTGNYNCEWLIDVFNQKTHLYIYFIVVLCDLCAQSDNSNKLEMIYSPKV